MYDLESYVGQVVTIRLTGGEEIISTLLGVEDFDRFLTLGNPMVVVVNNDNVSLLPFAITTAPSEVVIKTNNVLSVMPSAETYSQGYLAMIAEEAGK